MFSMRSVMRLHKESTMGTQRCLQAQVGTVGHGPRGRYTAGNRYQATSLRKLVCVSDLYSEVASSVVKVFNKLDYQSKPRPLPLHNVTDYTNWF
jgi:hypothetical protein